MKRYRGVGKTPGPSVSPPRQGRLANRSGSIELQPSVTRSSKQTADPMVNRPSASSGGNPLMIQGSGANNFYLDPRTKQPVLMPAMPQAGRSIPQLKMGDLTSSLPSLSESDIVLPKVPLTKAEKRIAATLKEVTAPPTKDMLESFDEALRTPDMKAINARVAQLKKGLAIPSISKLLPTRSNNLVGVKSKDSSNTATFRKQGSATGKAEEKNIRMLMDQLKNKYLDDMESQLGLAIERRPRQARASESSEDQSGGDGPPEFAIPRPSTNATEITARIDKVVRNWTAESQKMARSTNVSKQASFHQASRKANQDTATSPLPSANTMKEHAKTKPVTDALPEKNENLERISSAFRKTLDPISKRDVRELINISEEDHVDKLQEEHEERRRAHDTVFKNTVVMHGTARNRKDGSRKKNAPDAHRKQDTPTEAETKQKVNNPTSGLVETQKDTRKPFSQAIEAAKDDEDEMYTIIKDHMAYEMASRPPKLSVPRKPSYTKVRQQPSLLRSDAAGKALLKYSDSHRKLQNLVDAFQEKVGTSTPTKRVGPPESEDSLSDTSQITSDPSEGFMSGKKIHGSPSQTTLPSRKHVTLDVTATLSKSVKSIGRASSVVQRLGTLMSRVSLRNEKYDYEKQLEEEARTVSIGTDPIDHNGNFLPPDPDELVAELVQPPSTMALARNSGVALNPYEKHPSNSAIARGDVFTGPHIAPGVSKLDSVQFGKYVAEMSKVAEKAAESFEKFKETQFDANTEPLSSSEGEGLDGDVDLTPFQQPQKQRPPQTKVKSGRTTTVKVKNADTGISPRGQDFLANIGMKKKDDSEGFKFLPDMSYTDQLMLQKLRKLKEKEGWGDSMQSQVTQISQAANLVVGGTEGGTTAYYNSGEEMDSLLKRASAIEIPKDVERPGMGAAVSLNAILRARMSGKGRQDGK